MINQHPSQVTEMDDAQIDRLVISIVGSLGSDARAFGHASETYNSKFFENESPAFKQRLCQALAEHFSCHHNTFWQHQSSQG